MGLLKIILWGLVIYYLYKFVFNVVVPVSRATSQVKRSMQQMQEQQAAFIKQQQAQQQNYQQPYKPQASTATEKKNNDDYLDFEEIKA